MLLLTFLYELFYFKKLKVLKIFILNVFTVIFDQFNVFAE